MGFGSMDCNCKTVSVVFIIIIIIHNSNHTQPQVNHLGHLRSLIDAQKAFYTECLSQLTEVEVAPAADMGSPTGL